MNKDFEMIGIQIPLIRLNGDAACNCEFVVPNDLNLGEAIILCHHLENILKKKSGRLENMVYFPSGQK